MSTAPTATGAAAAPPAVHDGDGSPGTSSILRLVIAREIRERGRSKAFTIGVIASLVLLGAAIVLPTLVDGGDVEHAVGTVGQGGDSVLRLAEATVREELEEGRELSFDVTAFDDEVEARSALAAGDVELVLVDGERILRQGSVGFGGSDLQDALQRAAAITALEDRLEGTGTTVDDVAAVLGGAPLPVSTVQGQTDEDLETARSLVAYGGMLLLYVAILMFGQWTLMGVAEEKSSRVVEVLLSTVKPWQLLAGKVVGIGLLGLAQFVLIVVWAVGLIRLTGAISLPAIPVDSALTLILWFVLGYGTYAVAFATAGALVSRMEDATSVSFPVSMIAVLGFLASFQVLDDPAGVVAQVGTYVPFVAPFVVPIRVAYAEIAVWEHVLSVVATVVAVVLLVRVAGRIYAGGLLHFGGRMRVRQAYRGSRG